MRKKYPKAGAHEIMRHRKRSTAHAGRIVWREGNAEQFLVGYLTVQRFRLGWMRQPDYALVSGEPDV